MQQKEKDAELSSWTYYWEFRKETAISCQTCYILVMKTILMRTDLFLIPPSLQRFYAIAPNCTTEPKNGKFTAVFLR
jgi:hypothetical protein